MVVEVASFQDEVIEASFKKPVLVDFWAPWCGPCRTLGPVLERLAGENEGAWTLAKVNTDENPAVSRQYGISSIPAVKLFVDGAVADEFVGALPETAVRQWLERALPSENRRRIAEAKSALARGDEERASALLKEALTEEPTNDEARILLARLLVFTESERALELVASATAPDAALHQLKEAVHTAGRLLDLAQNPEQLPDGAGTKRYAEALNGLQQHDYGAALAGFIDVVRTDRRFDEDGARKACLALFTLLGEQNPVTKKHRRAFDMALF